jgi:hypothetical protein
MLLGVFSSSLLNHGSARLDHVRGHAREPVKPYESGVYDGGGSCDLPCLRTLHLLCWQGDTSCHV